MVSSLDFLFIFKTVVKPWCIRRGPRIYHYPGGGGGGGGGGVMREVFICCGSGQTILDSVKLALKNIKLLSLMTGYACMEMRYINTTRFYFLTWLLFL